MSRVLVAIPYLQLTDFQPYRQREKKVRTRTKMYNNRINLGYEIEKEDKWHISI